MAPEFKTFIPNKHVDEYKRLVNTIPGSIIRSEGLNIEDLSRRVAEVLDSLDPDQVRIIDLDLSKNFIASRSRSGLVTTKRRIPPQPWREFYQNLENKEQAVVGGVIRPLIENRFSPYTLSELRNQSLDKRLFHRVTNQQLAENGFGIKFKTE